MSSFYLADDMNSMIRRAIESRGWTFLESPVDKDLRAAHIDDHIASADVYYGGRMTSEHWERAELLKWIHVPWAGVNSLLATRTETTRDIIVTNSSGIMADSVADQTMASMLMLSRDLANQVRAQDRREWARYDTESPKRQILRGKTLGILGYGAIGRALAIRARAFGMRVIATRRTATVTPDELDVIFTSDALDECLEQCDVIVAALPLTPDTNGLIDASRFARMKSTAHFINISRGSVVVEADLIAALENGTIAAAALDVFEREPLPSDSPLWSMSNVNVTPHSSGGFMGFGEASAMLFVENLNRWAGGESLLNVVRDGY